jgi:hypothetical protein
MHFQAHLKTTQAVIGPNFLTKIEIRLTELKLILS